MSDKSLQELVEKLETKFQEWDEKREEAKPPSVYNQSYDYGYKSGVSEGFRYAVEIVRGAIPQVEAAHRRETDRLTEHWAEVVKKSCAAHRAEIAALTPESNDYVAWLRYVSEGEQTRIVVCDSDAPNAFKVYRTACKRTRLERTAVLRKAAELAANFNDADYEKETSIEQEILTLIPAEDASLLDALLKETRARTLEEAASATESHMFYAGPGAMDPEPIQIALALRIRGMKRGRK